MTDVAQYHWFAQRLPAWALDVVVEARFRTHYNLILKKIVVRHRHVAIPGSL